VCRRGPSSRSWFCKFFFFNFVMVPAQFSRKDWGLRGSLRLPPPGELFNTVSLSPRTHRRTVHHRLPRPAGPMFSRSSPSVVGLLVRPGLTFFTPNGPEWKGSFYGVFSGRALRWLRPFSANRLRLRVHPPLSWLPLGYSLEWTCSAPTPRRGFPLTFFFSGPSRVIPEKGFLFLCNSRPE